LKRTQQDVGTIVRKRRTRARMCGVWALLRNGRDGHYAKAQRNVSGRCGSVANGRSCLAGVERVAIQRMEPVFQSIVRSIGKAIHARSNARTVFNQEVLRIHFESAHFATMGRGSRGRSEKAPQSGTVVEGAEDSPKTKSNIKGLLHRIFEYAMKWEILETQRNPMQFSPKSRGGLKRVRKKVVLTVEQYQALLAELPYHIQVMVMIAMCLGFAHQ